MRFLRKFAGEPFLTIQLKIILPLIFTIVIFITLILPWINRTITKHIEEKADEQLVEITHSVTALIKDSEALTRNNATLISKQTEIIDAFLTPNNLNSSEKLFDIKEELGMQEISLYSKDYQSGDPAFIYGGPNISRRFQVSKNTSIIRENLIIAALEERKAVSDIAISPQNSQIIGVAPVYESNTRKLLGVVLVSFHINNNYIENLSKIINADIAIFNNNEIIVSTIDEESNYSSLINDKLQTDPLGFVINVHYSNNIEYRILVNKLYISESEKGYIAVAQPIEKLFSIKDSIQSVLLSTVIIFGITILIFWAIIFFTFSRPVEQITQATTKIRLGDLNQRVNTTYFFVKDELTVLSENFNAMTESLKNLYTTLEEKVNERTQELTEVARTDDLTKAFNRRYFIEVATKELSRSQRQKIPMSLISLDADHFKKINDQYGHISGDKVLQAITALCNKILRQHDVFARFGGEEFIILLPNTDITQAGYVAERIRETIQSTIVEGAEEIKLTASFGVTSLNQNTNTLEDLLVRVDRALYQAKKDGRNCVRIAIN